MVLSKRKFDLMKPIDEPILVPVKLKRRVGFQSDSPCVVYHQSSHRHLMHYIRQLQDQNAWLIGKVLYYENQPKSS